MIRRKQHMSELQYVTMEVAYKRFFDEKEADGLSKETLATYKLHIDSFLDQCMIRKLSTQFVGKEMYQWWIIELQEDDNKKDTTVRSYCRSVRAFLYWIQDQGYAEVERLKLPKAQQTIKITYTPDEMTMLLSKPTECSEVEYQTWVFENLIFATGLRLSSALNIKVSEFDKKQKTIYVQKTKNHKALNLFLNNDMCNILQKYIATFELNDDDYIFCTAERTRLAKRTMQDNVATYNKKLGVEKTSIHLMRHTYAKQFYQKTKDIYTLSQVMGHSSIAITENYLKDLGLALENVVAYNPQQLFANTTTKKNTRRGKVKL